MNIYKAPNLIISPKRKEISKEEIPGKRSMYGYTDLLQTLKGERLSSVFSPDGTLISASAAPHCEVSACGFNLFSMIFSMTLLE